MSNFCPKCGTQTRPGARFCGSCGNDMSQAAAQAAQPQAYSPPPAQPVNQPVFPPATPQPPAQPWPSAYPAAQPAVPASPAVMPAQAMTGEKTFLNARPCWLSIYSRRLSEAAGWNCKAIPRRSLSMAVR